MATDHEVNVYHQGELAVQSRANSSTQARNSGRMVSREIIPGAIRFVNKQPFAIAGSCSEDGELWASIFVGTAGFMVAEPASVRIDLSRSVVIDGDPIWDNLKNDPRIGMLVIDLRTRARLRVNGLAGFVSAEVLHVDVEQAYPNCPQYIQRRVYRPKLECIAEPIRSEGRELYDNQQDWLANADTCFIASAHPKAGVDASHRGGNPGFIQVLSSNRIRVPDYAGNGMFNTLGNLAVDPRAGLLFPDFENGKSLQLTGRVDLVWDVDGAEAETGGTRRYWEFEVERWIQLDNALPGEAEFLDYSPHNPNGAA